MAYLPAFAEFWVLTLLKDVTAMNYIHSWMHNKNYPYFHSIHESHHAYRENLTFLNSMNIGIVDLFFENTIGPFLLVGMKFALGMEPTMCLVSFIHNVWAEGAHHSMNPYTISYYCPPIDAIMKGNIAHSLHHAKTYINGLGHPWHHITKGYRKDLDLYNTIMKTEVQF